MEPLPEQGLVWHELMTADPDAAERFYAAVVGVTVTPIGDGPDAYRMAMIGNEPSAVLSDPGRTAPPGLPEVRGRTGSRASGRRRRRGGAPDARARGLARTRAATDRPAGAAAWV